MMYIGHYLGQNPTSKYATFAFIIPGKSTDILTQRSYKCIKSIKGFDNWYNAVTLSIPVLLVILWPFDVDGGLQYLNSPLPT